MAHTEIFQKVKGESDHFMFGLTADLETDVIDALKMRPALRRFGRQLAKQIGVKGITFTRIDFSGVLDIAVRKARK